jgi:hypothetical protein
MSQRRSNRFHTHTSTGPNRISASHPSTSSATSAHCSRTQASTHNPTQQHSRSSKKRQLSPVKEPRPTKRSCNGKSFPFILPTRAFHLT